MKPEIKLLLTLLLSSIIIWMLEGCATIKAENTRLIHCTVIRRECSEGRTDVLRCKDEKGDTITVNFYYRIARRYYPPITPGTMLTIYASKDRPGYWHQATVKIDK